MGSLLLFKEISIIKHLKHKTILLIFLVFKVGKNYN